MAEITLSEQIACVRREIGYRERVYPRLVEQQKMSPAEAQYQYNCMVSVLGSLIALSAEEFAEQLPLLKEEDLR